MPLPPRRFKQTLENNSVTKNPRVHYATIFKTFGIEEIREILCTLQAHYVFCMHLWDVIIHI